MLKEKSFSSIDQIDPIEFTQKLRGEVFTYIDIIMTTIIVNEIPEENKTNIIVNDITELLYDYLDFTILYLDYYRQNTHLLKYLPKNAELYLVESNCAVLAGLYEVLFTVKRIFGFDERVAVFYRVSSHLNS